MQDELVRDIWNEVIAKGRTSPAKVKEVVERHLGKKEKPKRLKPFEVGKTYDTKYQTGDKFTIVEIKGRYNSLTKSIARPSYFLGILSGKEHLGNVPVNVDRLIQQTY